MLVDVSGLDWGSVAEWVAGVGAFAASAIALYVSAQARKDAERAAQEARQVASRARTIDLLVQLVRTVERDATSSGGTNVQRTAEGASLCRALWGHRNLFGTAWHLYCEDDQRWIQDLVSKGQLVPRIRSELQEAIDSLDHQDRRDRAAARSRMALARTWLARKIEGRS